MIRGKRIVLESITVRKPCDADWEQMPGDDLSRYCDECGRTVYDLSAMARAEAEALIAGSSGRLCARFSRLSDGSVATRTADEDSSTSIDDSPSPKDITPSAISGALAAGLLLVSIASVSNKAALANPPAGSAVAEYGAKRPAAEPSPNSLGALAGTIYDVNGAVIVKARLTLTGQGVDVKRNASTAENGSYEFAGLSPGRYNLKAEASGFRAATVEGINIGEGDHQTVDLTLQVATMDEVRPSVVEFFYTYEKRSDLTDKKDLKSKY